jgi:hypothetical protein
MSLIFSLGSILLPEFRGFPQVAVEAHRPFHNSSPAEIDQVFLTQNVFLVV